MASHHFFKGCSEQGYKLESAVQRPSHTVLCKQVTASLFSSHRTSRETTYRVHSLFLQLGFLQVVALFSHTEQSPALTDLLVDFRLREVWKLLLYFQVNIIIVEKVSRSETQPEIETLRSFYINSLGKNKSTRFRFVSRSCDKQVTFNFTCKCTF